MTAPLAASPQEVAEAADRLGYAVPRGHESDYLALLQSTDAACRAVLDEPDYKPQPDFKRFPRTNVHLPLPQDNPLGGWAWRADVGAALDSEGKLLSGKTVVFKDTVCLAGVPLVFGTNAFEDYVPDVDASVVTSVLEHGGHILGKAACESFSHGAQSSSSPFGPVENPHAAGFSAGGSSSGCGALIGSGAADMGIGGDQGGSIRIPAALCGIVGLKPTFGLVPYTGVLSSDSGTDHVGPMARTVLDTAALLQAVAGYDGIDDRQLGAPRPADVPPYVALAGRADGARGLRIGVLADAWDVKQLTPDVARVVRAAIARFADLGAHVGETSIPTFTLAPQIMHVINKFSSGPTRAGRATGRRGLYLNDYFDHLLPWTQDKYDKARYYVTGTAMSCEYGSKKYPTAYGRAQNLSRRLRDEVDAALQEYDVLVMPTLPQPARRHIPLDATPLQWTAVTPGITSYTGPFNLTGHPALTLPVGRVSPMPEDVRSAEDAQLRLPVGMQLVGRQFDEATLLQLAYAWEQSVDWDTIR